MRIAVDNCQIAARMIARQQPRCLIEQSPVEVATLRRHEFAEAIREPRKLLCEASQVPVKGIRVVPTPHRGTKTRIVPPSRVKARLSLRDAFALLQDWRQRPFGGDEMRLRQIFEQQMPRAVVRGVDGLKTVRRDTLPHDRDDIAVERDLAAVRVRWTTGVIKVAHFENKGTRSVPSRTVIVKAQPESVRPQFRKGSHHRDLANRYFAERAGSTKRFGEMLGVSRFRQGVRYHINPQ